MNNANIIELKKIKPEFLEIDCSSVGVRLIKNTKLTLKILKFL